MTGIIFQIFDCITDLFLQIHCVTNIILFVSIGILKTNTILPLNIQRNVNGED